MDKTEQVQAEIAQLSQQLREHQHLYYVEALPSISDEQYDRLMDRLIALETAYPSLRKEDSPSQRVGSDLGSSFAEVEHTIAVLSLDKAYWEQEVLQWMQKTEQKVEQSLSYVTEPKVDGVSLVLYYEQGVLQRAVTRGNGYVGNDITSNAKTIKSIPLRLTAPLTMAVRGEVFLPKEEFERLNSQSDVTYANPRNLAAGVLRRIKSSETAQFPLAMFAYEAFVEEKEVTSHLHSLELLKELGFYVNPLVGLFTSEKDIREAKSTFEDLKRGPLAEVETFLHELNAKRSSLPYEIDGAVIKVNELQVREQLGYTGHHPRWALAYKFDSPQAQSVLSAIDVQVGRTGRITPVGRVEPVLVGNSVVSNVTLHNQAYIDMLELAIGDSVSISKRGDVIPALEKVVEKNELGNVTFRLPGHCPSCATALVMQGAHLFCPNKECPDQVRAAIEFFVGRSQMDIEGFGPQTVELLINKGWLHSPSDIYTINYLELVGEPGFGQKKAQGLQEAVQQSKKRPYRTVLLSLGLPDIGKKAVDLLVDAGIRSIDELYRIVDEQDVARLTAIKGFGDVMAASLLRSLDDPSMRRLIELLKEAGLSFEQQPEHKEVLPQIFANQVWVVTGSFKAFNPRSLALKEIEKRGGSTRTSISKQTTHLLTGKGGGSKIEQARQVQAIIVSEEEFVAMLEEGEKT